MQAKIKDNKAVNIFNLLMKTLKYSFFYKKGNCNDKIMLKFDDLSNYNKKVIRIDILVKLLKFKVLWGIIGKSLENPDRKYTSFLKKIKNSPYYHLFNHGYLHLMGDEYEFENKTKEEQKEYINKTQKIVFEKTGILLDTFAAPCNHIDHNTSLALKEIPEIKYFLFGSNNFGGTNFVRTIEMENSVGNVDFEYFKSQWKNRDKNKELIVLQGHPYAWNIEKLLNFAAIIQFLKKEGCKFVLPNETN